MRRLVSASTIQGSSFVEVRKVGCHGLAVLGKAVLFDMSALQSHGLVEDSSEGFASDLSLRDWGRK